MSKLFSDSLLSEFSYTGKKGKKKFSSLFICFVIFGEYSIIIYYNVIDYIYFSNKITSILQLNTTPAILRRNFGGNQFLSGGVFRQHQFAWCSHPQNKTMLLHSNQPPKFFLNMNCSIEVYIFSFILLSLSKFN